MDNQNSENNNNQQEYNNQQQSNNQQYNQQNNNQQNIPYITDKDQTAAIASYITWIGFIVALCIGDRQNPYVRFHLNQALVLNLASMILEICMIIPIVNFVAIVFHIVLFVFWIMALVSAANRRMEPMPLLGGIHIL